MWVPRSCAFCRGGYDAATGSDSRLRVNRKGDDWHFPSRCSYFRGTHPCNERKDGAPSVVAERRESQKKGHPPEQTWEAEAVAPDWRLNQPACLSARLKPCPTRKSQAFGSQLPSKQLFPRRTGGPLSPVLAWVGQFNHRRLTSALRDNLCVPWGLKRFQQSRQAQVVKVKL